MASGASKAYHLSLPQSAHEDGSTLPLAVCEFPSLESALEARNREEHTKDVLGISGK